MNKLIIIALVLSASASASAQHERDGGFIRMATGLGGPLDGSAETGNFDSLALGWSVTTGIALQFELWGDSATAFGFGPGITYYLMPINLYWSASWGYAGRFLPETSNAEESGWSAAHMFGKEWWVSNNWSIGVATQVIYSDFEDEETWSLGVLFSATYN